MPIRTLRIDVVSGDEPLPKFHETIGTPLLDALSREGKRGDAKLGRWRALGQTKISKVDLAMDFFGLLSRPSEAEKEKRKTASASVVKRRRSRQFSRSSACPLPQVAADAQNWTLGSKRRASKRRARVKSPREKRGHGGS